MKPRDAQGEHGSPDAAHAGYRFATHGELEAAHGRDWLVDQLHELGRAAMGRYDGIIESTAAFRAWSLLRPGQSGPSRLAAVGSGASGGPTVVSSLLVTAAPLRFGEGFLRTAIVDSVMTHPDHQRRGLSRELMRRALDFMKAQGFDLSLLYTVPDRVPFRFYQTLGYVDYLRVAYLRLDAGGAGRPPGRPHDGSLQELQPGDPRTRKLFGADEESWGWTPLTEELWRWRRIQRPAAFPARLFSATLRSGTGFPGAASASDNTPDCAFALVRAPIRRGGGREWITMLGDVVSRVPLRSDQIRVLLGPVPPADAVISLCADANVAEMEALLEAGFRKTGEESAMLLSLTERGTEALRRRPPRWHTITESVTGF